MGSFFYGHDGKSKMFNLKKEEEEKKKKKRKKKKKKEKEDNKVRPCIDDKK